MSTSTATRFLRRDSPDVKPWAETCGQIRCLIEAQGDRQAHGPDRLRPARRIS